MIKNIVYCFDGTWNKPSLKKGNSTNVEKAKDMLLNDVSKSQIVHYHPGIGTKGVIDRIIGGATGHGISSIIRKAYFQLSSAYRQGADIYLFGFSRGAYTARSLSGFVNLIGVLRPDAIIEYKYKFNRCLVSDAYIYYMLKDNEYSKLNRISQKLIYKENKRDDFTIKGIPFEIILSWAKYEEEMVLVSNRKEQFEEQRNFHSMAIEFIGVWDTVGSIGPPQKKLKNIVKPWVDFHDTFLSPNVKNAFQALALHEIRCHFKPVLWTKKNNDQLVKQVWFAGAHSDVGGGNGNYKLSNISLKWMIDNAKNIGIKLSGETENLEQDIHLNVDLSRDTIIHRLSKAEIRNIAYNEEEIKIGDSMRDCIYAHKTVKERLDNQQNKYFNNCLDMDKLQNIDKISLDSFNWKKNSKIEQCLFSAISTEDQKNTKCTDDNIKKIKNKEITKLNKHNK